MDRDERMLGAPSVELANRFGALMEALPDGILIADADGRIAFVNGRLEDLSGYRRGEMLGRPVEMLVPEASHDVHERHRYRFRDEAKLRPMGTGLDTRLRRKDGTEISVDIQLSPVEMDGTIVTVAAVRDIAERMEAEQAIREGEERLVLAGDRERIARALGDDVIGSLFAIGMSLQGLAGRIGDGENAQRLDKMIADLDLVIEKLRNSIFGLRN